MIRRPLALVKVAVFLYVFFLVYLYYDRQSQPPNRDRYTQYARQSEIVIPKTVHQLLLSMPGHPISSFTPSSHTISWQQSGWKVEYWSEDSCTQLAQEMNTAGAYLTTFQQLPTAVLRSDFCRYLILLGRGGVYNDLDVHLMKQLPWNVMGPPIGGVDGPPAFIVGLEGDASTKGLPRSPQFVQWTIASTPSHPILRNALDRIVEITPSYLKQATESTMEMDVMSWTGPSVWTDAVLAYLDCTEEELKQLRDLKEPLRLNDVLVLPKRSFAIIQGEDHKSPDILVKHYFSGTWKSCRSGWTSWVIPWGC